MPHVIKSVFIENTKAPKILFSRAQMYENVHKVYNMQWNMSSKNDNPAKNYKKNVILSSQSVVENST